MGYLSSPPRNFTTNSLRLWVPDFRRSRPKRTCTVLGAIPKRSEISLSVRCSARQHTICCSRRVRPREESAAPTWCRKSITACSASTHSAGLPATAERTARASCSLAMGAVRRPSAPAMQHRTTDSSPHRPLITTTGRSRRSALSLRTQARPDWSKPRRPIRAMSGGNPARESAPCPLPWGASSKVGGWQGACEGL